ncbi:UDP-glycosyltransferase 73C1 [Forsythia ovata]|uniref:Glycosyltransferase n=1 Tax=Forsythia ovata TaxID=205694 RepID=A0ABD1T9R6_9LAMI
MAIHEQKLHFVLLPFMAQGHTIPMVDIARLLAKRGVIVTILTTPLNNNRFKAVVARAIHSGLHIRVVELKFPSVEAGLPEGCENFDMIPSMDFALKFFAAAGMLRDQVEELLQKETKPAPSCLISDMCFPWTTNVAQNCGIPRILFHGTSCFSLLCLHILEISKDFENIASDTEYFVVPGLPDRIEMTKAQLRGTINQLTSDWNDVRELMKEAETEAFGVVANTFEELEPEYLKEYIKVKGKKVWCIGPVSLCNKEELDKAERGNKASIDEDFCTKWLDSKESNSVLYVCLGSLTRLATAQLIELGLGLEASNRPFVWVIRNISDEFQAWFVEEKFVERIKGRGLLIHGWAPQVLILSHPAIGGFITHCGWNSTLEGICAGVPMITWPIFAEQFCNEKFIVNVLKTGLRIGVEIPVFFGDEEKTGVLGWSQDVPKGWAGGGGPPYGGVYLGGWLGGSLPQVPTTRAHHSIYNPSGQETSDIGGGLRLLDFSLIRRSLWAYSTRESDLLLMVGEMAKHD